MGMTTAEILERERDAARKRAEKLGKSPRFQKAARYYEGLARGLDFALEQLRIGIKNFMQEVEGQ